MHFYMNNKLLALDKYKCESSIRQYDSYITYLNALINLNIIFSV